MAKVLDVLTIIFALIFALGVATLYGLVGWVLGLVVITLVALSLISRES